MKGRAVFLMSIASGLPLVLVGSTLQAWFTVTGASLAVIGALTLIGQPYVFKFIWAPLVDRYAPLARLGRRRNWVFLMQIGLLLGLVAMAFLNPVEQASWLVIVAFLVAFLSATQDIAVDAYRTDLLREEERGMGAAASNLGYRLAMLVAGAGALILAQYWGWRATYLCMAGIMLAEMIFTLFTPQLPSVTGAPMTLQQAVITPVKQFMRRERVGLIILFIISYKLCDAFALSLNMTFLIRGIGFDLAVIGTVYKLVSLVAALLGSFVGGWAFARLGLFRSLLYFGILQALANLSYCWLAWVGKSVSVMGLSVFTEYFCGGLGSVAFVVFLMGLCDARFSASQYALFSAIAAMGRVFVGPEAAWMVNTWGWSQFYLFSTLIGFFPLLFLKWIPLEERQPPVVEGIAEAAS